MAFPVVQTTAESSTNSAGTNHTVTLPSGIQAGDLILVCMDIGSTAATLNAHADYTELLDENLANGLKILYRRATGGETNPTFVTSANTRDATITLRISGAADPAVQPPQIGTTSSGSSATPDPPASATPSATKDFLFVTFFGAAGEEADDDTWSDTPPTNYTPSPPLQKSCGTAGTNLGGLIALAHRQLNTGSAENPGTFAKDVSAAWRAQTIMIHPDDTRRAQVSFAEMEVPNAPRRAFVSFAEVELPNAPRRAYVSFAEMEVPDADVTRRAFVSFAEMEVPNAPRRAILSWAEMEAPNAPRRAYLSWAEFEVPGLGGGYGYDCTYPVFRTRRGR